MNLHPADRINSLPTHFFAEHAKKIDLLKTQGADLIHLDIGSPDLPPPEPVTQKLISSVQLSNNHGYQSHRWTKPYIQAWVDYYRDQYDVQLSIKDQIVPLIGSKEGIFHLMLALINPGDTVLVPDPGYITYRRGVEIAGGIPIAYTLDENLGYIPNLASIPSNLLQEAKLMWVNFPNNPTGASTDIDFFSELISYAKEFNMLICHDAAYAQISDDSHLAPSIFQVPGALNYAVEFNTLSKTYGMAGWRVGVALGNKMAINPLFQLKTNADSGHFLPIIEASVEAFSTPATWIVDRNNIYKDRRNRLVKGLESSGLNPFRSSAGLYVWAKIPEKWTSNQFATAVLENTYVSITPGTVFGAQGEGYVRFSITNSTQRIEQAINRIYEWMKKDASALSYRR